MNYTKIFNENNSDIGSWVLGWFDPTNKKSPSFSDVQLFRSKDGVEEYLMENKEWSLEEVNDCIDITSNSIEDAWDSNFTAAIWFQSYEL